METLNEQKQLYSIAFVLTVWTEKNKTKKLN